MAEHIPLTLAERHTLLDSIPDSKYLTVQEMLFDLPDEEETKDEPIDLELKAMFDAIPDFDALMREEKVSAGLGQADPRVRNLIKYWTVGEGGTVKIKWGVPGDGKRCIRHLTKYIGTRAPGFCQNLHRKMVAGQVMGSGPGESRKGTESAEETKREFSSSQRDNAAQSGHALPDGSYPIENVEDLKNAIQAYGRAKDKEACKRHIIKRAKALGHEELLPESWSEKAEQLVLELKELEGMLADVGMTTEELKVRRVRTPAGVRRFGQAMHSIIVPDVVPEKERGWSGIDTEDDTVHPMAARKPKPREYTLSPAAERALQYMNSYEKTTYRTAREQGKTHAQAMKIVRSEAAERGPIDPRVQRARRIEQIQRERQSPSERIRSSAPSRRKRMTDEEFAAREKIRKSSRSAWIRNAMTGGMSGYRGGGYHREDTPEILAWKKQFVARLREQGFSEYEIRMITGYSETAYAAMLKKIKDVPDSTPARRRPRRNSSSA